MLVVPRCQKRDRPFDWYAFHILVISSIILHIEPFQLFSILFYQLDQKLLFSSFMSVVFGDALIFSCLFVSKVAATKGFEECTWSSERSEERVPRPWLLHVASWSRKIDTAGCEGWSCVLCQRTKRKLQEMSEEHCFVTVAVLSHGRLRAGSELPDMVCYDSLGEHIDSNDADLDEVLLEGFCSIQVPEGKRLKVWLLLDCCQSNEEISRWRAPERMTRPERRCFGHPSHVDFLYVWSRERSSWLLQHVKGHHPGLDLQSSAHHVIWRLWFCNGPGGEVVFVHNTATDCCTWRLQVHSASWKTAWSRAPFST